MNVPAVCVWVVSDCYSHTINIFEICETNFLRANRNRSPESLTTVFNVCSRVEHHIVNDVNGFESIVRMKCSNYVARKRERERSVNLLKEYQSAQEWDRERTHQFLFVFTQSVSSRLLKLLFMNAFEKPIFANIGLFLPHLVQSSQSFQCLNKYRILILCPNW